MITAQQRFIFKHMVELPHCECVFCSTEEDHTGRTRLFLVFRGNRKVYMRHSIKGHWEMVVDPEEQALVWEGFQQAVLERKIPSFVAASGDLASL
ncbi:MAG: hypothetical protein WCI27_02365 [Candidatus Omnitrophota bacterium]